MEAEFSGHWLSYTIRRSALVEACVLPLHFVQCQQVAGLDLNAVGQEAILEERVAISKGF